MPRDALPSSLINSNMNLKWKQRKRKELGHAHWFATLWGKGACWSSGMGLGRSTSTYSLTRTCTNQTTSWLVHNWSTFGAKTSHGQTQIHNTHHGLDLKEATTFPLIVYFVPLHEAHIQMAFCPRTPKWESRNSQSWDSHDFGAS
jgi:hypothetical protein